VIVVQDVTAEANDVGQLEPLLERLEEANVRRPEEMLADAGYWSEENAGLEQHQTELFIATTKDWKRRKELGEKGPPRGLEGAKGEWSLFSATHNPLKLRRAGWTPSAVAPASGSGAGAANVYPSRRGTVACRRFDIVTDIPGRTVASCVSPDQPAFWTGSMPQTKR